MIHGRERVVRSTKGMCWRSGDTAACRSADFQSQAGSDALAVLKMKGESERRKQYYRPSGSAPSNEGRTIVVKSERGELILQSCTQGPLYFRHASIRKLDLK